VQDVDDRIVKFFSSLSDPTRLKLVLSIFQKPRTVTELHNCIGEDKMSLSAISHQLKTLSDAGIVLSEKNGREKTFSLSNDFCWCILRDALAHFKGSTRCKECSRLEK